MFPSYVAWPCHTAWPFDRLTKKPGYVAGVFLWENPRAVVDVHVYGILNWTSNVNFHMNMFLFSRCFAILQILER